MNQKNTNQESEAVIETSKIDARKIAEAMPVDPGTENICLSCE